MRSLVIAAATAVGFALPVAAATANSTSPGSNGPGYNTPSYNQEAKGQQINGQQANGANSGQQNWANGPTGRQSNAGQGWQNHNPNAGNAANVGQRIYQNLAQAGFTDIRIMPRAFMVHAKDRDGNPVTMMITPNSVMALTAVPGNGGQSMPQQSSGSTQNGMGNNGNGSMTATGNSAKGSSSGTTSE